MADDVLRLEFGVAGGGSIDGVSGKKIKEDIEKIAQAIEDAGVTKLKWSLGDQKQEQSVKRNTNELKKQAKLILDITKYQQRFQKNLTKGGLYNPLEQLKESISTNKITTDEAITQFTSIKTSAASLGLEVEGLQDKFSRLLGLRFSSMVSGLAIDLLKRQLVEVYNNVVTLDKAVVNLSMVTGYNRDKTKELLNTYSDMAQKLGAVTSEVAAAADDWLRQGYSLEETNKLIETSMVLSKIGAVDSADATQYLTSALKGYKIEIEDAMSVADKMSAVDMEAAVSVAGLAEGMSKTANSARLAGVEMDTLLGYLAAVGEVTQQDMASVGNAFKTMFARYSNVKLGRLVDDEGESLNDYETVLKRVGISLRDNTGSFRDFDDVLDDVQAKWSSLTEVEQSAIGAALGATRQKENVLTLMENYGNAMEYAGISAESAGTAMEKYDAYSQGIEASSAKLKATFESMSTNLLNSDSVVMLTDLANAVLKLVDGLAEANMLIPIMVGGFASIRNVGVVNVGGIYPRNTLTVTLNESLYNGKRVLGKTADTGACKKRIAA